ncbi:hypothetical protein F01_550050 [Burkholderia cenocepacia]|nr:hypothetical protein F01_550050 [Burkholderia cenocepacia]
MSRDVIDRRDLRHTHSAGVHAGNLATKSLIGFGPENHGDATGPNLIRPCQKPVVAMVMIRGRHLIHGTRFRRQIRGSVTPNNCASRIRRQCAVTYDGRFEI